MNIAVRGIGIISALGNGAGETLAALRAGRSGIGKPTLFRSAVDVPVGEVRRDNRALGELLGIPARETPSRTALLGMIAAAQAVADAAIPAAARVALVSGTSVGGMDLTENFYRDFRSDNGRGRLRSVAGHDCADSTRRIAEYCGITGYTATVSTACSSAANAVITGALLLENDMADYVVAGGTDALCRFTLNGFNSLSILDRERCRPFDATRAGLNLGEGAGYVVLAREEPGMRSYCRLAGYANANDAHHQTASSETGEGAYRAMAEALARSGLERVDYINAHGTATPNNDLTEGTALRRLFGELVPPFSSTKGFTGHALAAAGGEGEVLFDPHRGGGAHHRVLEHAADECRALVLGQVRDVGAVDDDLAGVDKERAGGGVEHRGLARAVAADDGDEVAVVQRQTQAVQRGFGVDGAGVKGLIKFLEFKHGHCLRSLRSGAAPCGGTSCSSSRGWRGRPPRSAP